MGAESQEELRRLEQQRSKERADRAYMNYHRSAQNRMQRESMQRSSKGGGSKGCMVALIMILSSVGFFSFFVALMIF